MEPLARLDSKSILSEEIFLEVFDQEDEITKARMILSLTDRAGELGVKKKFEELLKAYKRVDKEAKQRERKKPTLEKGVAIIYNQAFKELCKSGGFSDKAFLSWADRKGLIETQGGRMTKVKKVDGNPIRCVFLRLNDNIDKDGFEPVETMDKCEQEELPFK